jgi:choline dehydrogenase
VYPLLDRGNLTVLTGALATRVLFERRRAIGIEFDWQGETVRVNAGREVVVSLGAIHTPKLLMHSGIGDEAELKRMDIPVLQALPGVGRNLHDHVVFGCVWECAAEGPPPVPRSQTACFSKTDARLDAPNFYAYSRRGPEVTAKNAHHFNPPACCWSLVVGMRPRSRGTVRLTGPKPMDPVKIDANYLADPQDLKDLAAGIDMARAIGNSVALRPYTTREVAPGNLNPEGLYDTSSATGSAPFGTSRARRRWAVMSCRSWTAVCGFTAWMDCASLTRRSATCDDWQHDGSVRRDRRAGRGLPQAATAGRRQAFPAHVGC